MDIELPHCILVMKNARFVVVTNIIQTFAIQSDTWKAQKSRKPSALCKLPKKKAIQTPTAETTSELLYQTDLDKHCDRCQ